MRELVPLAQIKQAQQRLAPHINATPLVYARALSERLGCDVFLKAENLQRTGAFKIRGALNKVMSLNPQERQAGLITASSGNHALGVALAGMMLEAPVTVVMPETAPTAKVEGCRAWGATVVLAGRNYDEAFARAKTDSAGSDMTYLQSFDDHAIMAGQGTIALEILRDLPEVGTVIGPIGGGGLLSGMISALKAPGASPVAVIGVEAAGAASMLASKRRGQPSSLERVETLADGIAVGRPGDLSYSIISWGADRLVAVDDEEILRAMGLLLLQEHLVVEPAGAAGLAALLAGSVGDLGPGPVVLVLTGGNTNSAMIRRALAAYEGS